jgi:YVTN family beta-propeller protein
MHRVFALVVAGLVGCRSYYDPPATAVVAHPVAAALSARLSGINGRPFAVRISARGVIAITQQDLNTVTLTDTTNSAPRSVKVGADPGDVVFNSTGSKAYVSAFNGGTITIVDVTSAAATATIPIAFNAYRLAIMPDDSKLFVTSTDGHVYVVDLASLAVSSLALSGALNGCALDPHGASLYVTATSGTVWKIDVPTLRVVASVSTAPRAQEIAVAPTRGEVYVANETGWVDVLNASTLASQARIAVVGAPFGLATTPDGAYLYVASPLVGSLAIIDATSRVTVKTLNAGGTPRRVVFDRLGLTGIVANEGNYVDVIR